MDAFGGVMVDSQDELTVQSLLSLPESSAMGLSGQLMAQTTFIQGPPTEITLDEDDVFQCGKCKKVFTSFQLFMFHKKKHQLSGGLDLSLEEDLDDGVTEESSQVPHEPNEDPPSQAEKGPFNFGHLEEEFDGLPSDIGQPIMLEDQDALNFSIDQGVLNISPAQLPEGGFVPSSLASLPSVSEPMKHADGTTSDASTTWLLTKGNDNLSLVAASYGDERTLFLDEAQKCVVDVGSDKPVDKVPADLEFPSDDLLPEVPFPTNKEVFLDGTSRVIMPAGGYMLKSGMDYINSGELLASFDKVGQQPLVTVTDDQSNDTVSVNVLHVEMASLQDGDPPVIEAFQDDKKKKKPRAKKPSKPGKITGSTTPGQKLKCAYCSKRFAKNFDLQQHQRSHTGEKPFQCIVCGRAFAQKSNVKKHMETHKIWPKGIETLPKVIVQEVSKPKPSNNGGVKKTADAEEVADDVSDTEETEGPEYVIDNSYTCQFCDASHDSYFSLKTHLKTHMSQKVYWCNQHDCMKMFPDLNSFLEHTHIHTTKEARYRCHVCKLFFKSLSDLGIHQYTHDAKEKAVSKSGVDRYICLKCRSRFTSPENLEYHLATASHHHPCPECRRIFSCERNLRRHLLIHSTVCPYVCTDCGKTFKTETYLNAHRIMHNPEKPYVCEHCPAAFSRRDRLARHRLTHQTAKKYKCPFHSHLNCSREFNRQDKLKQHILTHLTSTNKEQQCQFCQKDCRKVTLLRRHERKCPNRTNVEAPHRKTVKRKDGKALGKTEEESAQISLPSSEKQARKQPKKTQANKDSTKSVTFKVCPTKSRSNKRKKNRFEIAASEADSQSSNTIENVPTIEIIVMPLSLNVRTEDMDDSIDGSGPNETGLYRVMFPTDSSDYPVDLTTGNDALLSRGECEINTADQEVSLYTANAGIQKL